VIDGTDGRNRRRPPIFALLDERGVRYSWLADQTGYSKQHVWNVSSGVFAPGPKFRAACARVMGLPESDLFHPADASPSTDADASVLDRTEAANTPIDLVSA
jgi:hypothetical protein